MPFKFFPTHNFAVLFIIFSTLMVLILEVSVLSVNNAEFHFKICQNACILYKKNLIFMKFFLKFGNVK